MMGSTLIFKTGVCLHYLNPLLRHRSCVFYNSAKLPTVTAARTLCSSGRGNRPVADRDSRQTDRRITRQIDGQNDSNNDRQTDGQNVIKDQRWRGADSFRVRERPSFPKSVFAAGTARRTAEMMRRKAAVSSLEEEEEEEQPIRRQGDRRRAGKVPPPDRPLSPADWRKLKEDSVSPKHFDLQMMLTLLASGAELDIAKSLLAFVAMETGTLTYELLLRYLTLCVKEGHDAEVFDLYGIMRGRFGSLDTGASSLFIKAFSRTERWREAVTILQEVNKVITPSPRNYSDVIAGATLHGDARTAWALYDEVIEKGLSPHQDMWETLFRGGGGVRKEGWMEEKEERESMSQSEYQKRLFSILHYMRDNQQYPQQVLASTINTWFESLPGQNWKGSWTTINPKGVCVCCRSQLESIHLSSAEYEHLKERVMTDVIQGQDVFNKTTPEELEMFKVFVKSRPAFDVVVDGLNVANITRGQQSETLLAVVSELESQGRVVLVLGRKHMLRPSRAWDRHNMSLIQKRAHCFYTENISEDDPFLLYASLHSGNQCCFVSRDLMRDHKACLSDGPIRRLFFKWQRGHQMVVGGAPAAGRRVDFQNIPSYDTIIQTSGDSWHIPYDDDTNDRSSYEVPQRWLCLTRTH